MIKSKQIPPAPPDIIILIRFEGPSIQQAKSFLFESCGFLPPTNIFTLKTHNLLTGPPKIRLVKNKRLE